MWIRYVRIATRIQRVAVLFWYIDYIHNYASSFQKEAKQDSAITYMIGIDLVLAKLSLVMKRISWSWPNKLKILIYIGDSEGGAIIEHSYLLKNVQINRVLSKVFFTFFHVVCLRVYWVFNLFKKFQNWKKKGPKHVNIFWNLHPTERFDKTI